MKGKLHLCDAMKAPIEAPSLAMSSGKDKLVQAVFYEFVLASPFGSQFVFMNLPHETQPSMTSQRRVMGSKWYDSFTMLKGVY